MESRIGEIHGRLRADPRNWAAYVPDLSGCVATAAIREEVEQLIGEGIRLHLELMRESGEEIPAATTSVGSVDAN
ncbi:MAG: type II toxin-antitoxin system HicB family antitoxin [Candidatus Limnocylindrales bacterium]